MKIKICGLRSEKDVEAVNAFKPDYIGFIFYPPSFRNISKETAVHLKAKLDSNIKAVGVFVDEPLEKIVDYYDNGAFDIVQLHGSETNEMVEDLRKRGIPVIKALRIKDKESFKLAEDYTPDMFLFDVYSKKGVGGTGDVFDWDLMDGYTGQIPYLLAGGIDTGNIDEALKKSPYGLDVSSGAETDRVKDPAKIKALIEKVRRG